MGRFRALRVLFGPAWSAAQVLPHLPPIYAPNGWKAWFEVPPSKEWNFEDVVEAERMFHEQYAFFSGTSA